MTTTSSGTVGGDSWDRAQTVSVNIAGDIPLTAIRVVFKSVMDSLAFGYGPAGFQPVLDRLPHFIAFPGGEKGAVGAVG